MKKMVAMELKINEILILFRQTGLTFPWAAGGRMAGLYAKKLKKC
jgi:hypothetical protein